MDFDMGTPLFRVCDESTYYIEYCNTGSITAEGAFFEISIDSILELTSANVPFTPLGDNVFQFDLGNVGVFECGEIQLTLSVPCDENLSGVEVCLEGQIFPDSLCGDTLPGFDGPWITAQASCDDSDIIFTLENIGNTATPPGLTYIIIEDAVLLMEMPIDLDSGQVTEEYIFDAEGFTYHIVADQAPGVPGPPIVGAGVVGCNDNSGTSGFLNMFSLNGGNPFTQTDCREIRNAYDPNDKQAFPKGYGEEHFIFPEQELNYLIRFQNTGNDTAFKVVIVDTLSNLLDTAALEVGLRSHDYIYTLTTNGQDEHVLTFTFDNILLPDSTTNEPASHGFVKYKIAPVEDIPLGSVIYNRAGIYFGINSPIITNTTFHTIGENFILLDDDVSTHNQPLEKFKVQIAPNPFDQQTQMTITGAATNWKGQFLLYSSQGELLRMEAFSGDRFNFNRAELPGGFYFFKIEYENGKAISGKLIIR